MFKNNILHVFGPSERSRLRKKIPGAGAALEKKGAGAAWKKIRSRSLKK